MQPPPLRTVGLRLLLVVAAALVIGLVGTVVMLLSWLINGIPLE